MDNKYLFRVYHFDKNGDMTSPFLSEHTGNFGNTEVAAGTTEDVGNEFGNLWHKGKFYPKSKRHFGFSAIGKVDPRYSIFSGDYLGDDDILDAVQNEITKGVPETAKGQRQFARYYADDEKDDYEFLTNKLYSPRERTSYLSQLQGQKGAANAFTISPELFNFDSDEVWDNFASDIDVYDTFHMKHPDATNDNGDRVVLVTAPEDKVISADDIVKNGYTQQRDFPTELVTSEVTPVREFSEYPQAMSKYETLRSKGASGPEAFAESFRIEPGQVVSDKQLKDIYKDICFFANSSSRHKNILKGLMGLRQ